MFEEEKWTPVYSRAMIAWKASGCSGPDRTHTQTNKAITRQGVPPAPTTRTSGNDQVAGGQPRESPGKGCLSHHKYQKNTKKGPSWPAGQQDALWFRPLFEASQPRRARV